MLYDKKKFGFSVEFFCVIYLLYFYNILITTNFKVLKFIKNTNKVYF